MGEAVWIIGTAMTRFQRYPDKDSIDLASQATLDAFDDAGVTIRDIDLIAAGSLIAPVLVSAFGETAALLAYTDLLAGDLIESSAPMARRRLRDEVRARVLGPYRDNDQWWWFGLRKKDLNNWTPWIHANLLATSLLLDDRPQDVLVTAGRAIGALDRYLDAVPDDGGCDEGISYWWRAGASLFECLQTLACACGEDYGVYEIGKIRAIARYPVIAHIAGPWHVNFADGSPKPHGAVPHLLYRFGAAVGDQEVAQHARALRGDQAAAADLIAGAAIWLIALATMVLIFTRQSNAYYRQPARPPLAPAGR